MECDMDTPLQLGDQFPVIDGKTMGFIQDGDSKLRRSWQVVRVKKPWGSYTDHYRTDKVVFKLIDINPNSQLSLQSHEDRQEMWVVIEGECVCYLEGHSTNLKEGDNIFIPTNSKHRLSNESKTMCTIAEMQFGTCSEDDITRYEDDYNRQVVS
jgi:mannose-6-phosphate isomerase-like protein (cupin superfamily)